MQGAFLLAGKRCQHSDGDANGGDVERDRYASIG